MPYDPQPFYTADGVKLEVGLAVWLTSYEADHPLFDKIKEISENGRKIIGESGYHWRVDGVFSNKDSAVNHIYNSRVNLRISEDDAHLIHYALSKRLAEAQHTLNLLKIARERELTKTEMMMLPFQLSKDTREELAEQIDPWISLASNIEYLISDVEKAIGKVER